MVVLSLPERIWTPDIVWEKDDSSSEPESPTPKSPTTASRPPFHSMHSSVLGLPVTSTSTLPPPPPISSSDIADPESVPSTSTKPGKVRTKSKSQKYFSKDECAICMDSFQRGEVVRILPCGHVFHKDECDEWLMKWRKLVRKPYDHKRKGLTRSAQHAEQMLRFLQAHHSRELHLRQSPQLNPATRNKRIHPS